MVRRSGRLPGVDSCPASSDVELGGQAGRPRLFDRCGGGGVGGGSGEVVDGGVGDGG